MAVGETAATTGSWTNVSAIPFETTALHAEVSPHSKPSAKIDAGVPAMRTSSTKKPAMLLNSVWTESKERRMRTVSPA